MKIAVIQFPGSTGLHEIQAVIERAGMTSIVVDAMQATLTIDDIQGYVLPGGASFNDEPAPGIIAANLPIMSVLAEQVASGKPVLGIGNGAQILVASGLVPGVENNKRVIALTDNKRSLEGSLFAPQAYHAWVDIKLSKDYQRNAFTSKLNASDVMSMPLSCSSGRFVLSDALLYEIQIHGLNVLEYQDDVIGSMANIAAISNKAGNVLAMMPHPEYTSAGDAIFSSMKAYIESGYYQHVQPLHYYPRQYILRVDDRPSLGAQFIVSTPASSSKSALLSNYLGKSVQCFQYVETNIKALDLSALFYDAGLILEDDAIEMEKPASGILIKPRVDIIGLYLTQTYRKKSNSTMFLKTAYIWTGISSQHLSLVFNPIIEDGYHYHA